MVQCQLIQLDKIVIYFRHALNTHVHSKYNYSVILEILTLFIDFIMPKCIILVLLIMIEHSIQKVSNTL